jgi:hypothetical protein
MTEIAITTRKDDITTEAARTHFFSKAEIDFLKGVKNASPNYERVLLHRIFAKLDCFRDEILPILAINQRTLSWVEGITKNCNGITDFSNNSQKPRKARGQLDFAK